MIHTLTGTVTSVMALALASSVFSVTINVLENGSLNCLQLTCCLECELTCSQLTKFNYFYVHNSSLYQEKLSQERILIFGNLKLRPHKLEYQSLVTSCAYRFCLHYCLEIPATPLFVNFWAVPGSHTLCIRACMCESLV